MGAFDKTKLSDKFNSPDSRLIGYRKERDRTRYTEANDKLYRNIFFREDLGFAETEERRRMTNQGGGEEGKEVVDDP